MSDNVNIILGHKPNTTEYNSRHVYCRRHGPGYSPILTCE